MEGEMDGRLIISSESKFQPFMTMDRMSRRRY